MRRLGAYILVCAALVVATAGVISVFLPPVARSGLWVSGVSAWVIQAAAASARVRWGGLPERLLAVWGWSAGGRLLAIGLAAAAVYRWEGLHPVSTLVGLAGYLFAMLLLEAALLRPGSVIKTGTT